MEESSASSLRVMFNRFDPFKEESSPSLPRIVFLICLICWGRVFYFLHGDGVFNVLEPLKMVLDVLNPLVMVFDVFDRGKSLLLPLAFTGESFDNFVP